ncbi:MAG: hypothetical protein GKC53_06230 [Neisseriaceae bacterium]|nr:MAG: hypothetical protein GKC53_06230 [Neisseriaceae bacterium]
MFKKPEEIIIAILGIVWIILCYFINRWLVVSNDITVQIILYNIVWVITTFLVWKNEKIYLTWPIFLGLFVTAWTPLLTWYAQKSAGYDIQTANLMCIQMPWFATWYVKFGLVLAVMFIGYIILLIKNRKK